MPAGSSYAEQPVRRGHPLSMLRWQQDAHADVVQLVVPDGVADVLLGLEGGDAVLVGPALTGERVRLPAGTSVRGLRLRPAMVGPMLGISAHELLGETVPVRDLVDAPTARLLEAATLGDDAALERLGQRAMRRADPRVQAAARSLASDPAVRIDDLTAATGMSPRQLRRRFVAQAGIGPKAFARIARLQGFLRRAERAPASAGLAELAFASGYSDQPHLTREVRELTGLSPAQLLRARSAA